MHCLLTIKSMDHRAYQPSSLSTIEPIDLWSSFATFKPFGLLHLGSLAKQKILLFEQEMEAFFWTSS